MLSLAVLSFKLLDVMVIATLSFVQCICIL